LSKRLMQLYFNLIYMPLYDHTVAQTSPYQRLQKECVGKLRFGSGDEVLCVGVGTGSEILSILGNDGGVLITGIDASPQALRRARKKVLKHGKEITAIQMDAHRLEFAEGSFDKVFCVHVMGFLEDDRTATQEIMRVLKKGGQYVITYPSGSGSFELTGEITRNIWRDLRAGRLLKAVKQCFATAVAGIAYAPGASWVKPRQGFYSQESLKSMLNELGFRDYRIEEDRAYQDIIVYGGK
jgi:ubiquinone/menaquinone biosynthesis C-methylase UbiE